MKKSLNDIIINKKSKKKIEQSDSISETISESITDTNTEINNKILKKKSSNNDVNIKNVKIDELIYPCKDEILYTRVILHPYQMNNDLYVNLKQNLIDKVENKCIKDGYIIKVYKILEYKNGILEAENFTGSAIYSVKYLAKICIALKESIIIAKVSSYIVSANFALADFGPEPIIKIIFTKNNKDINMNNFLIKNDKNILHIKSQKILNVNDYIKIQLKTIRFFQNDNIISCIGHLIDLATTEEIEKFGYDYNENKNIDIPLENNINIFLNEDQNIDDNVDGNKLDT
jgi:DNA-directed RNA polymerase subunit E'/Rpb7